MGWGEEYCVVCGNPDFASFENDQTTFEICDICGYQSGYEYMRENATERALELRRNWIGSGAKWWHGKTPEVFDPIAQLERAGLEVPKGET